MIRRSFKRWAKSLKGLLRWVASLNEKVKSLAWSSYIGFIPCLVSRLLQGQLRILFGAERPKMSNNAFDDTDPIMEMLTHEMQSLVIESRLRQHPVVRTVWEKVSESATKVNSTSAISSEAPLIESSQPELPAAYVTNRLSSSCSPPSSPTSPTFTLRALSVDPGAL